MEGDKILVLVRNIRDNGNIDLEEMVIRDYEVNPVMCKRSQTRLGDLKNKVGYNVSLDVEIAQIKQTSGPTIFTMIDETGKENGAAFIEAGKRAYPEVELGDIVHVSGEVMMRNDQLQVEISYMEVLSEEEKQQVLKRIEKALDDRAYPEDIPFMIESEVLEKLKPAMKEVAFIIRKAVFTNQPIILRHHADADGIVAAVSVEKAITS